MKPERCGLLVALLLLSVGWTGCSSEDPAGAGGAPGGSSDPAAETYTSPIPEGWNKVDWRDSYPDFTYRGLSPSCTHCPMDECESQFYFFARGGTVNNLVVYFEGGGACWHTINCIYYSTTNTGVSARVDTLGENAGIGDVENPDNPFREWNFIYIPYCTGDVHAGANDYDYPDDLGFHLIPEFNYWRIRHRGKVNFRVVLQWIQDTFTVSPDKVFVAGSSAGAYGAILNFPDVRDAFPTSSAYCFPDAGNGIMPDNDAVFKALAQRQWDLQLPWQVEAFIEGTTDFTDFSTGEMYAEIAKDYPDSIIAPYTAAWDHNQIFFYWAMLNMDYASLLLQGVDYWRFVNETAEAWNPKMYAIIDEAIALNQEDNIRYYVSPGCNHTILGNPMFYEEVTSGYTVAEWLNQMVETGLAGLPHVFCEDCGAKPDYLTEGEFCDG